MPWVLRAWAIIALTGWLLGNAARKAVRATRTDAAQAKLGLAAIAAGAWLRFFSWHTFSAPKSFNGSPSAGC